MVLYSPKLCFINHLVHLYLVNHPVNLYLVNHLGGGGTLIFSAYLGSDPASTVHPKKYQEFQAPQKIFEILATPKNIPILYLDLKKDPKLHRNDPQTSPIL